MWLLVAGTSLLVAEAPSLQNTHILDLLMSKDANLQPGSPKGPEGNLSSIDSFATMALDQMNYLELSSDYMQLGSTEEQSVAFGVKAAALVSYLNCSFLNEDAADVDVLASWLEDALADHHQMADENLASVVLRALALTCRINPDYATSVSRLLPRFIVQASPDAGTVLIASRSLAFALQDLSPDAVISTLYTLGNVLSPGSDKVIDKELNGDASIDEAIYPRRQSVGSSISLQFANDDETTVVWSNVVQAVCEIAAARNDEKITALAQSMLMQKVDKVNHNVDAQVIVGAAALALKGSQLDFRSLLKTYARVAHEGLANNKGYLLDSVSPFVLASPPRRVG